MNQETVLRKQEHLSINNSKNVSSALSNGLENYHFIHQAIPEVDMQQITTDQLLFGRKIQAPFMISSMTGGTQDAGELNKLFARAAQKYNIALGIGSQRAALENPTLIKTFQVRNEAPDILLFANIGAVQLNYGYAAEHCKKIVDMIEADALFLHFNVLQEALQPEGNTNWAGLLKKIEFVCKKLEIPVIAKEVGWGFSTQAVESLINAGISAIDVSGAGGTSWSEVEAYRAKNPLQKQLAHSFIDWGISTAETLTIAKKLAPHIPIFASGGLKNGIDAAKCIALGASLCGFAGNFLRAAMKGEEELYQEIELYIAQLRVTMLCTDSTSLQELLPTKMSYRDQFRQNKNLINAKI